jgi:hypothetical protein
MTIPTIDPMTTPVPTRADRATFAPRADVTMSELPVRVTQMNAAIAAINAAADAIDVAEDSAGLSAATAVGAANFKGEWSTLSGALAIPAAVSHNGVVYILLASTANVALITPGVSSQWLPVLTLPLYTLPILQANAGYVAASAMEVLGATDADSLLTGGSAPTYGAYSGSNFVISSGASTDKVATSPDGETWTLRTLPSTQPWGHIASDGAGTLIIVTPNGSKLAKSTNHGVTWSALTDIGGTVIVTTNLGFHYVGGLFVLPVGSSGSTYNTSPDGVSWTGRTLPGGGVDGNAQFRMVGSKLWFRSSATATTAFTTTDGINWTTHTASCPAGTMVTGAYPDGSLWGCIGSLLYRTTDGITWTLQSVRTPVSGSLPVVVNGVMMVMTGQLIYTYDAGVWTARAKGLVTAVDLPQQWSTLTFMNRGHVGGLFLQLAHIVGRTVAIKPGSGSASGLFRKA